MEIQLILMVQSKSNYFCHLTSFPFFRRVWIEKNEDSESELEELFIHKNTFVLSK